MTSSYPKTTSTGNVTRVPIDAIHEDRGTQARVYTSAQVVEDLAEDIERGAVLPPLTCFDTGDGLTLVDGFHRLAALRRAGATEVDVRIHDGDLHEARWFACAVNQGHGLRRSNADKRRAVRLALSLPQAANMSAREIAEHVGVSHQTVCNIRAEIEVEKSDCQILTAPEPEPEPEQIEPEQPEPEYRPELSDDEEEEDDDGEAFTDAVERLSDALEELCFDGDQAVEEVRKVQAFVDDLETWPEEEQEAIEEGLQKMKLAHAELGRTIAAMEEALRARG